MKKVFYVLILFSTIGFFNNVLAANIIDYKPLVTIPTVTTAGEPIDFDTYITKAYTFSIALSFAIAVVMLVIAGFQYFGSESFTKKEDGKNRIWAVIQGLLLIITAYIILNTINPDLVNSKLSLQNLDSGYDNTEESKLNWPVCIQQQPEPEAPGWYLKEARECQDAVSGSTSLNINYTLKSNEIQCQTHAETDRAHLTCVNRGVIGKSDETPTFPGWWIRAVHATNGGTYVRWFGPFNGSAGKTDQQACLDEVSNYKKDNSYQEAECKLIGDVVEYRYTYSLPGDTTVHAKTGFKGSDAAEAKRACQTSLDQDQTDAIIAAYKVTDCKKYGKLFFTDAYCYTSDSYNGQSLPEPSIGECFPSIQECTDVRTEVINSIKNGQCLPVINTTQ